MGGVGNTLPYADVRQILSGGETAASLFPCRSHVMLLFALRISRYEPNQKVLKGLNFNVSHTGLYKIVLDVGVFFFSIPASC